MMSPANQQSAYELFPTFRVLEDDDINFFQVGIAIIEQEFESEEEEESEKDRIKAAEGLLDFAEVLNGDGGGIEIEIAGKRGTYYMTYEGQGGPEGGYFTCISRLLLPPVTMWYRVYRDGDTAFNLNNHVDSRVEVVDDPDFLGSEVKAVKVWPAAVPAEVPAAAAEVPAEVPAEVLADAPVEVLADAQGAVLAAVPAAASHVMHNMALDIWVQTTYGEEYDWTFIDPSIDLYSAHEVFPEFHVLDDDGDVEVGIAIVDRESESEEEEFEDEKARIKAEENLLDFASVYNGNGIEFEISGQRGTYYMTYGGGPEGGYFVVRPRPDRQGMSQFYKIHRNWGTAFDLNNRVGRVELVDDPDMPDGHEVKAVKVWPAAVPAEVSDEADDPQYQEECWYCGTVLHIGMPIYCIKHITDEEHTVCLDCWHSDMMDDDDWVDMNASSEEDSDAE
jgi:hypothetical protein